MRLSAPRGLVVLAVFLLLGACTTQTPDPGPTSTTPDPTPTSKSTEQPEDDGITVDTVYGEVPLSYTVHPVQRSGDVAVLTIDWSVPDDAPVDQAFHVSLLMRLPGTAANLGQIRLVDLADGWVAWPEADGKVTTSQYVSVRPGETATSEAIFAAPPGEQVDVLLPYFGLVEDVPVLDEDGELTTQGELDVPAGAELRSATLESFSVAYDEGATAGVEGDAAVVTLASDVLFAFDESALTPEAAALVDDAAGRIAESAREGVVVVVGHTDDQGSDAYNMELSRDRADSVADRLRSSLGEEFTIDAEGKGKTEPVAEGASEEARAANRRVEIQFTTKNPGELPALGASQQLPDAQGVVGTGHDRVSVEIGGEPHDVTVRSVERRSGYLVGTLAVVAETPSGAVRLPFVRTELGPQRGRGFGAVTDVGGATAVALAGDGAWVFPVDYRTTLEDESPVRRDPLADRAIVGPEKHSREPLIVTVVWPDTGQDAVTVDVHGRFRITDIPVEDGS